MKLVDIFEKWEVIYVDEDNNVLNEAAVRQFKKSKEGNKMEKKYRCTSGQKAGKIVSAPASCSKRIDPKKRRQGKKIMRTKGKTIQRKSKISKKKSISKIVSRLNARMMGKTTKSNTSGTNK
jgi:hypothetical protein